MTTETTTDLITAEEAEKLLDECDGDDCLTCEYARTVIALHAQLADAQAAQAMVVERAVAICESHRDKSGADIAHHNAAQGLADAIRALAPIDGLALVRELREEIASSNKLLTDEARASLDRLERAEAAEAERDRLAAANAVLEAKVAGLVEAAEDAEYDLLQWLECSKSLTAAGFNMDGTADVTAKLTAALSHIKRGKTNG